MSRERNFLIEYEDEIRNVIQEIKSNGDFESPDYFSEEELESPSYMDLLNYVLGTDEEILFMAILELINDKKYQVFLTNNVVEWSDVEKALTRRHGVELIKLVYYLKYLLE